MPVLSGKLPDILKRVQFEMCLGEVQILLSRNPDLMRKIRVELIPGPCTHLKLAPLTMRLTKAMIQSLLPKPERP
jgi:hypothetical protein